MRSREFVWLSTIANKPRLRSLRPCVVVMVVVVFVTYLHWRTLTRLDCRRCCTQKAFGDISLLLVTSEVPTDAAADPDRRGE
jgi:hypothetical protein